MDEMTVETTGDVVIITLTDSYLDSNNSDAFKLEMKPILKENSKMVFDISKVDFIDSTGIGTILSCLRELTTKGGDLKLYGMTKPVRVLYDLVHLDRMIDILDNREEAVKAFSIDKKT